MTSILKGNENLLKQERCLSSADYKELNLLVIDRPCHHGMARPQVADRGTASDKEGSCE